MIETHKTYVCDHCGNKLAVRNPAAKPPGISNWKTLHHGHMSGSSEWLLCPESWEWFNSQMNSKSEFRQ